VVAEDGWPEDAPLVRKIAAAMADFQKRPDVEPFIPLAQAVANAQHPPGSMFISGVWDVRDDPGGVVFQSELATNAKKVETLLTERMPGRIDDVGFVVEPAWESDDAASEFARQFREGTVPIERVSEDGAS
jgi:hypothetical protein